MDFELINREIGEKEYRYDDLCTEFSCTGTKSLGFDQYSCFYRVTKTKLLEMNNTYQIILYKEFHADSNNFCFFSKQEIEEYLTYIEEIVGNLNFVVNDNFESEVRGYNSIKIDLTINGPHLIHTFVLTMIRYLYEHRYAAMLDDALKLKKTYLFRNMNIYTILCLVASSNYWSIAVSDDMSHFAERALMKLYSTEELKNRISIACSKASIVKKRNEYTNKESEYLVMPGIQSLLCHTMIGDEMALSKIKRAGLIDLKDCGSKIPAYVKKLDEEFPDRYRIYRYNYFKMVEYSELKKYEYIDELEKTRSYYTYASE